MFNWVTGEKSWHKLDPRAHRRRHFRFGRSENVSQEYNIITTRTKNQLYLQLIINPFLISALLEFSMYSLMAFSGRLLILIFVKEIATPSNGALHQKFQKYNTFYSNSPWIFQQFNWKWHFHQIRLDFSNFSLWDSWDSLETRETHGRLVRLMRDLWDSFWDSFETHERLIWDSFWVLFRGQEP